MGQIFGNPGVENVERLKELPRDIEWFTHLVERGKEFIRGAFNAGLLGNAPVI